MNFKSIHGKWLFLQIIMLVRYKPLQQRPWSTAVQPIALLVEHAMILDRGVEVMCGCLHFTFLLILVIHIIDDHVKSLSLD